MRVIFLIFLLFSVTSLSFVAAEEEDGFQKIQDFVIKILSRLIRFTFSLLVLISGGILIFLGIKYFFSKGDIKELHKTFLYVILGLILIFISFFVPNLLRNFLESNDLQRNPF